MDMSAADLEAAATHMGELLGWSAAEQERQIASCRSKREIEMRWLQPLQEAAHS
jgi:hypothetical protein